MTKLIGVLFLGILVAGCEGNRGKIAGPVNDTTKVLKIALRSALVEDKLPDNSSLFRGNFFNDSILVDIDSFPMRLLPATLDTLRFKFGSYKQVTEAMGKIADSLKPNYLYICCLERIDSVYSVSIQSLSLIALGGGGSMSIDIVKRADSFIVKHTYGNSIN